ncbi:hypothetical protein DAI22_07g208001 [Oryza sativa Japonica Group]|nr:hypothetical protein DAI22_07g208001 [Oryza sativa Japonica Group]
MDANREDGGARKSLGDITNHRQGHVDQFGLSNESQRKKERNFKQRIYRANLEAKKKCSTSPMQTTHVSEYEECDSAEVNVAEIATSTKREKNNSYLREWRARNRAKSSVVNSTVTSVNPTQATTTSEINQSEGGVVGTSELSAKKKREDTNKYLREWRARKKAKSTDGCNTVSSGTPMQSTIMTPEEHNEDGAVQRSSIYPIVKQILSLILSFITQRPDYPQEI